ncbi:AraC family transcriptional regulator [Melghiribacillus thermohalophilus]|uniref:AraC family transcriptional regulator n=1 Tax=Melghiribacillus thermohalophilus TaxID=1324956 RepID=A0A4R3MWH4_9BACI|nr:AraC family transcriptional regulator [Melghiribacillus thermohalophilus]TCT18254.1 AraC family transcriptional regulator [Melghiribacillus thermohalophilus]
MSVDYFKRISSAIDFMETNIHEEISLESISRHVGLSPFHFHRIFHSILGETITEYVKKRRLSLAARDLFITNKRIIDIAFDYGYESQEAFTRAFKKMFGVTPGAFRKHQENYQLLYHLTKRKPFTDKNIHHLKGVNQMEPKFKKKEAYHIVGLQMHSSRAHEIPNMWDELDQVKDQIQHRVSQTIYLGVMEPTGVNVEFNYIAGVEVYELKDIPEGMVGKSFPANEYVVFTHRGTTETLQDTFQYIYGTWFPKNGYDRGNGPEFELYDDARFFGPMNPDSEIDIYIPIKK